MAVCREFGIETGKDAIPQIAGGFAGGIGNSGSVCGAVSGAVMAIGLRKGRPDTTEGMLANLAVVGELRRRFEAEMGCIECRALTGLDLSTPEGLRQLMESDTPQRVCFPAVAAAYRIAVDLLKDGD